MVFDIDQFALEQLPAGQQRAHLLHVDILDVDGTVPTQRIICAMPRASLRSVLLRIVDSRNAHMARFYDNDWKPAGCNSR